MKAAEKHIRGDGEPNGRNGNGNEDGPITSILELKEFNERLIEVTKHLPVCLGSVFKVDSLYYPNWGFAITPENAAELKRNAEFYYRKDYAERRRNSRIESLQKSDIKVTNEKRMAEFMAIIVREMLRSMDDGKREFQICDIPAREGHLSAAIAHALLRDADTENLLSRTVFNLVDISGQKLDKAEETLTQFRAKSEKCITEDEVHFGKLSPGSFDIVVTLGHLHHKPFLTEYLSKLNKVLKADGALVIGDWHSPLCSHPAYVISLLQNLVHDSSRLDMFREIMASQLATPRDLLEPDETCSLMDHIAHWKSVMRRLTENPPPVTPRLYVNAAYDTSRHRQKKLGAAGFTVDLDDVRKAFPKAKLPQFSGPAPVVATKRFVAGSDSATVMAAVKRR